MNHGTMRDHLERAIAITLDVRGSSVSLPTRGVRCARCENTAVLAVDKVQLCEQCFNATRRSTGGAR